MNRLLKMTWITGCLLLAFTRLQAGNCETAQRVVTKNFTVSENATLLIHNTFGAITISEWDKNEISFTVTIKATTKKQSTSQELVDKVVIDFKQEKDLVSAITNCLPQKGKCDNCTYRIHYQVSVPRNIHYDLKTKSGNISMENAAGDVNISLMNGDLIGNEFAGNSNFDISYGKLTVKKLSGTNNELTCYLGKTMSILEVNGLKANIKHSTLSIRNVKQLSIENTHSDIEISRTEKIQIVKSFYGNFEIGEVRELQSKDNDSWYTKLEINRLTGAFSIVSLTYGKITVHNVMPSFENVDITATRSPIKMTLDAVIVSCQVETQIKGGEFKIDAPKTNISPVWSKNPILVSATFGDKEAPKAFIKIKTEDCKVNINQL